ncbi:MAG: hypothetical protein IJ601_04270 [Acidaminococcaceae bacterium]|nr:hypothetical protein [Acidaminococcaceae bacterium]
MLVCYDHQPEPVLYKPLPDGMADVWIRKDIREVTDEDGRSWTAEEVYFRTQQDREAVEAGAEALFFSHTDVEKQLTDAVQEFMDNTVKARKYDNIASACSYAASTNAKFRAEGEACVAWRDACWQHCYDVLNDVMAGLRNIPTANELLSELPVLEW